MTVKLEESWLNLLNDQFEQPYFKQIKDTLVKEKSAGQVIYPPGSKIFAALDFCPVNKVKAVIIGQDPYHNPGQAHGLCFSVPMGIEPPPSLINIFKELHDDLGINSPAHGNLESWAQQGILLLNASLTVRAHQAASHAGIGWQQFTDTVIQRLSQTRENLVFLLWGSFAIKKQELVAKGRGHLILTAPHPSPLSAYRGFFGCKHFSRANDYLRSKGLDPIDWSIK